MGNGRLSQISNKLQDRKIFVRKITESNLTDASSEVSSMLPQIVNIQLTSLKSGCHSQNTPYNLQHKGGLFCVAAFFINPMVELAHNLLQMMQTFNKVTTWLNARASQLSGLIHASLNFLRSGPLFESHRMPGFFHVQ